MGLGIMQLGRLTRCIGSWSLVHSYWMRLWSRLRGITPLRGKLLRRLLCKVLSRTRLAILGIILVWLGGCSYWGLGRLCIRSLLKTRFELCRLESLALLWLGMSLTSRLRIIRDHWWTRSPSLAVKKQAGVAEATEEYKSRVLVLRGKPATWALLLHKRNGGEMHVHFLARVPSRT
jgi:hypothetical protein